MKDIITIQARKCPVCGQTFTDHPALSRKDNMTEICPDCGVREALASIGVEPGEQEQILDTIHRHRNGGSN